MDKKSSEHSGWVRFRAFVVVFVFTATSVTWTAPVAAAPADLTVPAVSSIEKFSIPKEMGTVRYGDWMKEDDERNETKGLRSSVVGQPAVEKFVVLVQDAHAVIAAQENIEKILGYLGKEHGIRLTALEGAKGRLESILLRTFPEPVVRQKILAGYKKRAELSGPEIAAVLQGTAGEFRGMEDWALYEKNYAAYLRAQGKKDSLLSKWNAVKQGLDRERAKIYDAKLNEFEDVRENFFAERTSLVDLLIYLTNFQNLFKPASGYQELPGLIQSIGYEKSGKQEALAPLVRKVADEFRVKYLRGLGVKAEMNFYNRYQAFITQQATAGQMLQFLVQLGSEHGKVLRLTPPLRKLLGHAELLSEIKGSLLYDELQRFLPEVEGSLIKSPAAREIAEKYRKLFLLRELIDLELTHENLEKFQKEPDAYVSLMENAVFRMDLEPALEFYQAALERDQAFISKIDAMMSDEKQKAVAVVAGGFHTKGLERILKERRVKYAVVTPKIDSLMGIENYDKVMKGDVSFKEYLKTTYFDALMRHAAKSLAEALPLPYRLKTLKNWRDNVIRELAKEGRITDAGKYLPYIDEILRGMPEAATGIGPQRTREEILGSVRKQLEKFKEDSFARIWKTFEFQLGIFAEGLKELVEKKELTNDKVSTLLDRSGRVQPSMLAMKCFMDPGIMLAAPALFATTDQIENALRKIAAGRKSSAPDQTSIEEIGKNLRLMGDTIKQIENTVGKDSPEKVERTLFELTGNMADQMNDGREVTRADVAAGLLKAMNAASEERGEILSSSVKNRNESRVLPAASSESVSAAPRRAVSAMSTAESAQTRSEMRWGMASDESKEDTQADFLGVLDFRLRAEDPEERQIAIRSLETQMLHESLSPAVTKQKNETQSSRKTRTDAASASNPAASISPNARSEMREGGGSGVADLWKQIGAALPAVNTAALKALDDLFNEVAAKDYWVEMKAKYHRFEHSLEFALLSGRLSQALGMDPRFQILMIASTVIHDYQKNKGLPLTEVTLGDIGNDAGMKEKLLAVAAVSGISSEVFIEKLIKGWIRLLDYDSVKGRPDPDTYLPAMVQRLVREGPWPAGWGEREQRQIELVGRILWSGDVISPYAAPGINLKSRLTGLADEFKDAGKVPKDFTYEQLFNGTRSFVLEIMTPALEMRFGRDARPFVDILREVDPEAFRTLNTNLKAILNPEGLVPRSDMSSTGEAFIEGFTGESEALDQGFVVDLKTGDRKSATRQEILNTDRMIRASIMNPGPAQDWIVQAVDNPLSAVLDLCTLLMIYVPSEHRIYFVHSRFEDVSEAETLWERVKKELRGQTSIVVLAGGTNFQSLPTGKIEVIKKFRDRVVEDTKLIPQATLVRAIPAISGKQITAFFDPETMKTVGFISDDNSPKRQALTSARSEMRLDINPLVMLTEAKESDVIRSLPVAFGNIDVVLSALRVRGRAGLDREKVEFDQRVTELAELKFTLAELPQLLMRLFERYGMTDAIAAEIATTGETIPAGALTGFADVSKNLDPARMRGMLDKLKVEIGEENTPRVVLLMSRPEGNSESEAFVKMVQALPIEQLIVLYLKGQPLGASWLKAAKGRLTPVAAKNPADAVRKAQRAVAAQDEKATTVALSSNANLGVGNEILSFLLELGKLADPDLREISLRSVDLMIRMYASAPRSEQLQMLKEPELLLRKLKERTGLDLKLMKGRGGLLRFDLDAMTAIFEARQSIERAA